MPDYALALSDDELQRYRRMAATAREEEADLWRLAGVVAGARVADVGCGPGAVSAELAAVVAPTGSVTGVDRDPAALEAARQLLLDSGHPEVELREGDADATGLAEASYDVAMLRHVLAHGAEVQQRVVAHLASLVRPGGCVYLVDTDLTALRSLPTHPVLEETRERYAAFQTHRGGDPLAGLRLGQLLRGAGLDVLVHRGSYVVQPLPPGIRGPVWAARGAMLETGHVTADDLTRWDEAMTELDAAAERPTMFLPSFVAVGRRPEG